MNRNNNKALIAMSGGVDSSVAAYLIKEQGYNCVGCTMRLYDNKDAGISENHTCCSLDDIEDARSVAFRLGIPYYVFNFTDIFREKIICKFIKCYESGITPNPCIDCNRYIKFDKLYQRSKLLCCNYIVTGHYARIEKSGDKFVLKKALDERKDQSYVLYSLTQEQLAHTLFPLGTMHKSDTRSIAMKNGFLTADKPDSQDICFVPNGDYAKVIRQHTGKTYPPGNFVSADGTVLGKHRGIIHYTVGQRKGLYISSPDPLYVCAVCPESNTVVLGKSEDLFSHTVFACNFNWISGEAPSAPFRCSAKIRYRHREQPATVYPQPNGTVKLVFDDPQRAVTPGQSAVLYSGDTVLGGGEIVRSE